MDELGNRMTPAQIVSVFMKYLGDEIPALDAQDVLQIVLRTEGKMLFTPEQVGKISHRWAQLRYDKGGLPIFRSLCTALLRIYQAEAFCSLPAFKLDNFLRPFVGELFALCPSDERDSFKEELPNVKKEFMKSFEQDITKKMQEFEVEFQVDGQTKVTEGEWLQLTGERFQDVLKELRAIMASVTLTPEAREKQIAPLIPTLRETFANIINETVLRDRLFELIKIGQALFNRREVVSANLVLGFVAATVEQRQDQFLEKELSSLLPFQQYSEEVIEEYLQDPAKKKLLKPVFSNIQETRADNLLSQLVNESDAGKRKKLLLYLTVYEPEIFHRILTELRGKNYSKWFYLRNLMFLTTKIRRPADISTAEVLDTLCLYIFPGVYPSLIEESVRCYLLFDRRAGMALIVPMITAENLADVMQLHQFIPPNEQDQFRDALVKGVATIDLGAEPEAVELIIEALTKELSKSGSRLLGKFGGGGINQKMVLHLIGMLASTNTPRVVALLEEIASHSNNPAVRTAAGQTLESIRRPRQSFI